MDLCQKTKKHLTKRKTEASRQHGKNNKNNIKRPKKTEKRKEKKNESPARKSDAVARERLCGWKSPPPHQSASSIL